MGSFLHYNKYKKIKEPLQGNAFNETRIDDKWEPLYDVRHRKVNKKIGLVEMEKAIKKMKRKAPGHDGIFIDSFLHLGKTGKTCLLQIYNDIYMRGDLPTTWKTAILAPLLKKGKNGQKPESYRPISLLPVGGKILEGILLPRITKYMEDRNLIPCHQTGFRKGMSTSINIKRLYNHTYLQTARSSLGRPTVVVLFDAKKAFDTVWHKGILHKSMVDHLPSRFILFLRSWLDGRSLQVKVGGTLSKTVAIKSGVPQGALLSPLLWNYWTSDCPTTKNPTSDTSLYADDCAVWTTQTSISKTLSEVQQEIWTLNDWTKRKRIRFEPSKTKVLACHQDRKKREEIKEQDLYLDRDKKEKLGWDKHAVFLGVTFSENCTFNKHWDDQIKKAGTRISTLWRFRGKVSGETLYKVYKRAIEPIVTYASEVLYDSMSDIDLKKLLTLEFRAIRLAYNLPRCEPISGCLKYINKSVVTMIDERREKFVNRNHDRQIIMHTELLKHSEGRRIPCRKTFKYKGTPGGWLGKFYLHQDFLFFSGGEGTMARGGIDLEGIREGEQLVDVPREEQISASNIIPTFRIRPWRVGDKELQDREIEARRKVRALAKKVLKLPTLEPESIIETTIQLNSQNEIVEEIINTSIVIREQGSVRNRASGSVKKDLNINRDASIQPFIPTNHGYTATGVDVEEYVEETIIVVDSDNEIIEETDITQIVINNTVPVAAPLPRQSVSHPNFLDELDDILLELEEEDDRGTQSGAG